ncbi:MAG: hypothetical protein M1836_006100 [Candelina mexicana]|nr:MAG: hypothetical protein M1836_006100 [Candelina mexicana]
MEGNVPEIAHKEVGGPGSKGGGPRGAHKKWSGKGPTPARHIPWPEVFKHHISVVEGHTRMLEMVQKHTVPGTGNYNTITPMVERSKEMLRHSKAASRDFAPPTGQREKVPLGSSSVSMYPGYSPADIEYGKAAQEAGQVIAQVKASGGQWQPAPDGPQYSVGKMHGKRKAMFQKPKDEEKQDGDISHQMGTNDKAAANGEDKGGEGETLSFVVDTNPPPVNIPDVGKKSNKRSSANSFPPEPIAKKSKKAKTKDEPKVDTEDISAEVDARMKDKDAKKEEKNKKREEKKRKRSMDASDVAAASVDGAAEERKSKKAKKSEGETEGKGKKKRRVFEADADADEKDSHGADDGGKKKKRKKNKAAEGSE